MASRQIERLQDRVYFVLLSMLIAFMAVGWTVIIAMTIYTALEMR